MAVDDPGEDIGEIDERLKAIERAGFDQRSNRCPVLGAAASGDCHESCASAPVGRVRRASGPEIPSQCHAMILLSIIMASRTRLLTVPRSVEG